MPLLVTRTAEGVRLRREIAGAGSRYAAILLDSLLLGAVLVVVGAVVAMAGAIDPTGLSLFAGAFLLGGSMLAVAAYWTFFSIAWGGQTPGKRALGLRVVSADGHPASAGQHVVRGLFCVLELLPIATVPLGVVVAVFTPRRQRLGDLAAGTVVLAREEAALVREPWGSERWSELASRTLPLDPGMAARLDARDQAFLRDLVTRSGLTPEARRRLFVRAARHYAERLGLGPFADARVVLKELYLFAREARSGGGTSGADERAAEAPAGGVPGGPEGSGEPGVGPAGGAPEDPGRPAAEPGTEGA